MTSLLILYICVESLAVLVAGQTNAPPTPTATLPPRSVTRHTDPSSLTATPPPRSVTRHTDSSSLTAVPCASLGFAPSPVTLSTGSGRLFRSPHFPLPYPPSTHCSWTFQSSDNCSLSFICGDFNVPSQVGYQADNPMDLMDILQGGWDWDLKSGQTKILCAEDYLSFYDDKEVDEKFCNNTRSPAFTYVGNNMNVLFKTNSVLEASGFECEVRCVPDYIRPPTTPPPTTTEPPATTETPPMPTTTPPSPVTSQCVTKGGPGAGGHCLPFNYFYKSYSGCINKRKPRRFISNITVVPDIHARIANDWDIEDEIEDELEDDLDVDGEDDWVVVIEDELGEEIEYDLEDEIENGIQDGQDNDLEDEMENELVDKVENGLENDLENELESELKEEQINELEEVLEEEQKDKKSDPEGKELKVGVRGANVNSKSHRSKKKKGSRRRRRRRRIRETFWCATQVNQFGNLVSWGRCPNHCAADGAGSRVPGARRGVVKAPAGKTVGQLTSIIRRRRRRRGRTNRKKNGNKN